MTNEIIFTSIRSIVGNDVIEWLIARARQSLYTHIFYPVFARFALSLERLVSNQAKQKKEGLTSQP